MSFMFESLDVYRKAVDMADELGSLTAEAPRGCYYLTDQLNRAALSIATNLAEGNGRFTAGFRFHSRSLHFLLDKPPLERHELQLYDSYMTPPVPSGLAARPAKAGLCSL